MGVVKRYIWSGSTGGGSLILATEPNPDAYGMGVLITDAERATTDWTKIYDGTPVFVRVNATTIKLYTVYQGALVAVTTA